MIDGITKDEVSLISTGLEHYKQWLVDAIDRAYENKKSSELMVQKDIDSIIYFLNFKLKEIEVLESKVSKHMLAVW